MNLGGADTLFGRALFLDIHDGLVVTGRSDKITDEMVNGGIGPPTA